MNKLKSITVYIIIVEFKSPYCCRYKKNANMTLPAQVTTIKLSIYFNYILLQTQTLISLELGNFASLITTKEFFIKKKT